jgi:hypothetical protein
MAPQLYGTLQNLRYCTVLFRYTSRYVRAYLDVYLQIPTEYLWKSIRTPQYRPRRPPTSLPTAP